MQNFIEINSIVVMQHAEGQTNLHNTLGIHFVLSEKSINMLLRIVEPHDVDSLNH
jgi:hypothetical protein